MTGFRGIGPPVTVPIAPGAGLTLVVGRNGSGKSSFAEGLEVLLTGDLKRWERLAAVWQVGWRNLRVSEPTEIAAECLIEDAGPAVVRRTWAPDAAFAESRIVVQPVGEPQAGLERLGWQGVLQTYRPFLSHTELEAFFREPSRVYDLLASVLGLEPLTIAATLLATVRKQRESASAEVKRALTTLLEQVRAIDDERAATIAAADGTV